RFTKVKRAEQAKLTKRTGSSDWAAFFRAQKTTSSTGDRHITRRRSFLVGARTSAFGTPSFQGRLRPDRNHFQPVVNQLGKPHVTTQRLRHLLEKVAGDLPAQSQNPFVVLASN